MNNFEKFEQEIKNLHFQVRPIVYEPWVGATRRPSVFVESRIDLIKIIRSTTMEIDFHGQGKGWVIFPI